MPSKDLSQDELVVLYKEGAEKLEALLAGLPKNGLDESLGPEEWTIRACSIIKIQHWAEFSSFGVIKDDILS